MYSIPKNLECFFYGILGALVFHIISKKLFNKENFINKNSFVLEIDEDGNMGKKKVPQDLVTRSSGVLTGGKSQWNSGNFPTHFPYHPSKKNYIRGDTNIDGNVVFNGHVNLYNKWRISGRGDGYANDGWLRVMDKDGKNYHGGLAAGNLYSNSDVYAKSKVSAGKALCIGSTCINEKQLQVLTGKRKLLLKNVGRRNNECIDCGRGDDNCHLHKCNWSNGNQPFLLMSQP